MFPFNQPSLLSPLPKRKLLSHILISSKEGNIPPDWLLNQDVDTINFFAEQCEKYWDAENEYKRAVLQSNMKKLI